MIPATSCGGRAILHDFQEIAALLGGHGRKSRVSCESQ